MTKKHLIQMPSDGGINITLNGGDIVKIDVQAGAVATLHQTLFCDAKASSSTRYDELTPMEQWFVAIYRSLNDDDKNTIERILSLMDMENAWGDDDER